MPENRLRETIILLKIRYPTYIAMNLEINLKTSISNIVFCLFKMVMIEETGEIKNERNNKGIKILTYRPVFFQFSPKI